MDISLPVLAGIASTVIFAFSALPMLIKAHRTKDLASYSRGNILMANTGNIVHSVYVYSMPPGPIWLLHSFYLVTTAMMLWWYLRYELRLGLSRRGLLPWLRVANTTDTRLPQRITPSGV